MMFCCQEISTPQTLSSFKANLQIPLFSLSYFAIFQEETYRYADVVTNIQC